MPKPSDFTGSQRERLAKENAEEIKARADQISMMQSIQLDSDENDAFDPKSGKSLGRAETLVIDTPEEQAIIKVTEDITDMTFGAGNTFTFEVGKQYTVSLDLAEYLDELGYVWGGVQKVRGKK